MTKLAGNSLDDFKHTHDKRYIVPKKIRDGLAKLGSSWMYEQEFMTLCGIAAVEIGAYRNQFEEFFVETKGKRPKRAWAGTKEFAAKLREML